jgi:hypothetical protein
MNSSRRSKSHFHEYHRRIGFDFILLVKEKYSKIDSVSRSVVFSLYFIMATAQQDVKDAVVTTAQFQEAIRVYLAPFMPHSAKMNCALAPDPKFNNRFVLHISLLGHPKLHGPRATGDMPFVVGTMQFIECAPATTLSADIETVLVNIARTALTAYNESYANTETTIKRSLGL